MSAAEAVYGRGRRLDGGSEGQVFVTVHRGGGSPRVNAASTYPRDAGVVILFV